QRVSDAKSELCNAASAAAARWATKRDHGPAPPPFERTERGARTAIGRRSSEGHRRIWRAPSNLLDSFTDFSRCGSPGPRPDTVPLAKEILLDVPTPHLRAAQGCRLPAAHGERRAARQPDHPPALGGTAVPGRGGLREHGRAADRERP